MSRHPSRDAALALVDELAEHPDEAARRFVALGRWQRKKRGAMDAERLGRELGKSYREQVARIIGQHLYVEMYADESFRDRLHWSVRVGETLQVADRSRWNVLAEHALRGGAWSEEGSNGEPAVQGFLRGRFQGTRLEQALLAWRLCPLDNLAFVACYEYMFRKEWSAAKLLLDPLLRHPLDALMKSYAHEAFGAFLMGQKDLHGSSDAYRAAARCGEDRPGPLCMWFALALCLGSGEQAHESGDCAEKMLSANGTDSTFFSRALRYQRDQMGLPLTLHPTIDRSKASFGPHTRRIVDALS